jgi:hypothetical protein
MHGIQFIQLKWIHERCLGAGVPLMMPNMMLPVAGRSEEGGSSSAPSGQLTF